MIIWAAELKELEKLYKFLKGQLPDVVKELERLLKADDENMILLYSRRCLEVIITDLCECELKRPRKTEPLKGIIDRLHKEEKIPPHIITSMQNLNSVATFGAHPIEFNPRQVRTALIDLETIIGWFLVYKNIELDIAPDKEKGKSTVVLPVEEKEVFKEETIDKEKVKRRKNVKRGILIGSLSISTIIVLLIIVSLKPVPFSEKDWILITDFENMTGDSIFDQSLNNAFEVSIQQSSFVNVFQHDRINETLKRMGRGKNKVIDEDIGIEIAQREGIAVILVCNINLIVNVYLLTAKLVEVSTRKILKSETFRANGKSEVLINLDKLARKIRRDLGESLKEINHKIVALPEATTFSLEALKYFAKGNEAWHDEKLDEAEALLLKAIELDPEFAYAHASLGTLYYWRNNRIKGEEHFTKALNLSNRLSEKEKLYIQARIELFRGNYEDAVLKYNIYLRNYPSSSSAWSNLGYCYMMLSRYKESITAYTKSLEIYQYKDPNAYINIATCYANLKDYQQSIEFYLKAFTLNPSLLTAPSLRHEFGFTYVEMGEVQKARDVFERMIAGEGNLKAQGYRSLAILLMYTGKYSEAINALQEAILICKSHGYGLGELRNHLFLASAYKTKGKMPNFYEELTKVNELLKTEGIEPWWYFLYGKLLARDRKIIKAERILNEISARINKGNKSDTSTFIILKGEIQLVKGNPAEALDLIKTGVNFRRDGYTLESLANYYYDTGDLDMAIPKYKEIIEIKNSVGWEPQEYWIKAHYNLGKLYEKKGIYEQAIIYYQDFINIWKEADEDLPELIDAKSRLTKLQELEL